MYVPPKQVTLDVRCKCGFRGKVQTHINAQITPTCWLTEESLQYLVDVVDNTTVDTHICPSCMGYRKGGLTCEHQR